eukprot:TRINITY_DN18464_c0_g1_i1.p1 TRINITY_DN18464_c0_g1~~TRINITY_DN18464_c0_g1_i1.p1  ORF type:complete len:780 (+),score=168.78 TRINITY_DN18464_c0_g1_i1:47-2341(+)
MSNVRLVETKAVMYAPQDEAIPLLPGNNFHDDPFNRATLRKSHQLGRSNGQREFIPPTEYSNLNNPVEGEPVRTRAKPSKEAIMERWSDADKPYVFMGYFKEPVVESRDEEYRLRKVGITYYENDGTVSIREAKVQNSGTMTSVHGGGAYLVKRHKLFDENGEQIDLEDLQIGEDFECYGKVFKVLDCAERTRAELTAKGWVVPPALPYPEEEDAHLKQNRQRMTMQGVRKLTTEAMDVKRQAEFAVSGRFTKAHPETTRAAKQFFATSGNQHLTFNVLWDDRENGSKGDLRLLSLKYYLEDDTMELCENRVANSGRDNGRKFLCRQRVPLDEKAPAVQHNTFGVVLQAGFITYKDITIGQTYTIHGKKVLVYDADSFTRNWYRDNATELPPKHSIDHIMMRGFKEEVKHYPPPHDGLGSEEDSLGNWKSLMLKPLKKDIQKLLTDGHKILRFKAVMHEPAAEEDEGRIFVLNYYVVAQEFEIMENTVRNSGIVSGKFLGKTKLYKDHETIPGKRVPISHEDLYEGAIIPVLGRRFRLLELDARSVKYRDGVEDPPDVEKVKKLIVEMKDLLNQHHEKLSVALRSMASNGRVTVSDLERFFQSRNQPISRKEAKTILNYFDTQGNGYIDFTSFVKMMEIESAQNPEASSNRSAAVKVATISDGTHDAADTANIRIADDAQRRRVTNILRDKLQQRRMRQQEVFRLLAGSQTDSRLSVKEFTYGIKNILHLQLTDTEMNILLAELFRGQDKVTFREFSTFLEVDR